MNLSYFLLCSAVLCVGQNPASIKTLDLPVPPKYATRPRQKPPGLEVLAVPDIHRSTNTEILLHCKEVIRALTLRQPHEELSNILHDFLGLLDADIQRANENKDVAFGKFRFPEKLKAIIGYKKLEARKNPPRALFTLRKLRALLKKKEDLEDSKYATMQESLFEHPTLEADSCSTNTEIFLHCKEVIRALTLRQYPEELSNILHYFLGLLDADIQRANKNKDVAIGKFRFPDKLTEVISRIAPETLEKPSEALDAYVLLDLQDLRALLKDKEDAQRWWNEATAYLQITKPPTTNAKELDAS